MFSLPSDPDGGPNDHGFLLLTSSTGPMEWSRGNSYQAEALTNVLRYHTMFSPPSDPHGGPNNQIPE
jgi:hypothetical protein